MTDAELLSGLVDQFANSFWMHAVLDPIPGASFDTLVLYHYVLHVNAPGDEAFQAQMLALAAKLNTAIMPYACEYRAKFGIFCTVFSTTDARIAVKSPLQLFQHLQAVITPPKPEAKTLTHSVDTLFVVKKRHNQDGSAFKECRRKTT